MSAGAVMWLVAILLASWTFLVSSAFAQTSAPSPGSGFRHAGAQQIREVQRALKVLSYDPGPIDGVSGRRTRTALADFQKAEGLGATGTLDAETRSKLAARLQEHVTRVQKALKETGFDPRPTVLSASGLGRRSDATPPRQPHRHQPLAPS